jgi:hypothetical protein
VEIDETGAFEIARRARGTPRIANRLLRRVRDYAEVRADGRITAAVADAALTMLDVDHLGLDLMDRKLLGAMLESSAAARWASTTWRRRSANRPTPSRTCSNPTSSSRATCSARPAGAWRRHRSGSTSA